MGMASPRRQPISPRSAHVIKHKPTDPAFPASPKMSNSVNASRASADADAGTGDYRRSTQKIVERIYTVKQTFSTNQRTLSRPWLLQRMRRAS